METDIFFPATKERRKERKRWGMGVWVGEREKQGKGRRKGRKEGG